MRLYSTNNKDNIVNLKEAVLSAFPKDRGLYLPTEIPVLPNSFIERLDQYYFSEVSFMVAQNLIGDDLPEDLLYQLVSRAINFPAPLIQLTNQLSILELFHGPTMAFKDFGARFMAELMSYFLKDEDRETTILVATSGDTGGAVAAGFYDVPGIKVIILYPGSKVSALQEKQLTTWGKNITAIKVAGVFDDCQAMVKAAFLDKDLLEKFNFSSANSINIARLLPQSFYYFEAYKQLGNGDGDDISFCVPSGNFGNLSAGIMAKKMGLPVKGFIAATNENKVVPEYLTQGNYLPHPSHQTLSNAMDVGDPSNFPRMLDLCRGKDKGSTWNNLRAILQGYSVTDQQTLDTIKETRDQYDYIIDPHTAVGLYAASHLQQQKTAPQIVVLGTAHPGKFEQVMNQAIGPIKLPSRLEAFLEKEGTAQVIDKDYSTFKELLMSM